MTRSWLHPPPPRHPRRTRAAWHARLLAPGRLYITTSALVLILAATLLTAFTITGSACQHPPHPRPISDTPITTTNPADHPALPDTYAAIATISREAQQTGTLIVRIRVLEAVDTVTFDHAAALRASADRAAGPWSSATWQDPHTHAGTITRTATTWHLQTDPPTASAPQVRTTSTHNTVRIAPAARTHAHISIGDQTLGHAALLVARPDVSPHAFDVVVELPIETYVAGVVQGELLMGWNRETYRAQAIAARSYALHERARARATSRHYDLESTTRDQVFKGHARDVTVLEAVTSTTGIVLEHNHQVLRAYYSSTCGGRPASAADTWPTDAAHRYNTAAPIQARDRPHACHDSPLYTWSISRNTSDLLRRLRAYGRSNNLLIRNISALHSVQPLATNTVGRPTAYKLIEPGGTWYELPAEDLRRACNTPASGTPDITRPTRVNSSDLAFAVKDDTTTITGKGFGHGVGLCQYGTQGFATQDRRAEDILRLFYPDANLTKLWN